MPSFNIAGYGFKFDRDALLPGWESLFSTGFNICILFHDISRAVQTPLIIYFQMKMHRVIFGLEFPVYNT